MSIAIYGGSFNPPHLGHLSVVQSISEKLRPDRLLIIPTNVPPHKTTEYGSPDAETRLELCRLAFSDIPTAELSDMEIRREGKSYSADTVRAIRESFAEEELYLVIGTDMFLSFREWRDYSYLLSSCTLAVLSRETDDAERIEQFKQELEKTDSARILIIEHVALPMSSSDIRRLLKNGEGAELLKDEVYSLIIRKQLYNARANLPWLRERVNAYLTDRRRIHTQGCEKQAVLLARRWCEDEYKAAEAAILHDITKKFDGDKQLLLCEEYGIILDDVERENLQLLHARTGAELARELFGVQDDVYKAIRWHTTGKPDMSRLEKIIYLADFTEPGRAFEGVAELRELCFEDLDRAMALALKMSLEEIRSYGREPFRDTVDAYNYYKRLQGGEAKC